MTPEERNAAWPALERFYAAIAERALSVKDISVAKGLQIMVGQTIALQNMIDNNIATCYTFAPNDPRRVDARSGQVFHERG